MRSWLIFLLELLSILERVSAMYYKTPISGRAFKPFSNETVEVSKEAAGSYYLKKLVEWRGTDYAIYKSASGKEIMQSLQSIRFIRCRSGEKNINAKLTDDQAVEIFKRSNNGESRIALAAEFKVSVDTVTEIKNQRSWIRTTRDFMSGKEKVIPAVATVASRNKNKKLSPSLANFIRKDKVNMKMTTKQLAKKYCVSDRTIQRIIKGDMYK